MANVLLAQKNRQKKVEKYIKKPRVITLKESFYFVEKKKKNMVKFC